MTLSNPLKNSSDFFSNLKKILSLETMTLDLLSSAAVKVSMTTIGFLVHLYKYFHK